MSTLREIARLLEAAAAARRRDAFELCAAYSENGEEVKYFYVRGCIIVQADQSNDVLAMCTDLGVSATLARELPGLAVIVTDGDVPEVLERLEESIEPGVASPCHVACVAGHLAPGPAAWPRPAPWGHAIVARPPQRSSGARVRILDTGIEISAAREHPWLTGVTGDPDELVGSSIPGFQGHGTFMAGVVRALAPRSSVHVTATFEGGVVDEITLALHLHDAHVAARPGSRPDVVMVPGGFYTRHHREPLTSRLLAGPMAETVSAPLLLCAAGNDAASEPFWPGALPEAVAVGALEPDGIHPAQWSNYGPVVDIWAVGSDVVSSFPAGELAPPMGELMRVSDSRATMSGTSVAVAVAAGCVAEQLDRSATTARDAFAIAVGRSPAAPGLGPRLDPAALGIPTAGLFDQEEEHLGFDPGDAPPLLDPELESVEDWMEAEAETRDEVHLRAKDNAESGARTDALPGADAVADGFEVQLGFDPLMSPTPEARTVFPLIEAPNEVVAQLELEVTLGISATGIARVAGGPFTVPGKNIFELTVQLVTDGFRLRDGESWRNTLAVTPQDPYPSVLLHLTPDSQQQLVRASSLQVTYSSGGATLGWAVRSIAVVQQEAQLGDFEVEPESSETTLELARPAEAPDLTANILLSDQPGRLLWTFESPLVTVPDEAQVADVGTDPRAFARSLVEQIKQREGQRVMQTFLRSRGKDVADAAPAAFWELLAAVAERVRPTPPSVLIQSEDPFVPWELAWVDPPLDSGRPAHLGCQATVGRWVVGRRGRPPERPPLWAPADEMAVICGQYRGSRPAPLPGAEAEAQELTEMYGARPIEATIDNVLDCLEAPGPNLIHFAGHGRIDDSGLENGLVLNDGSTLGPSDVPDPLDGTPHVYLNACQVAGGEQTLGSYSGMAASFLKAGAAAVVAPLWDVNDATAKELVLQYYRRVLTGDRPAEVIRDLRGWRSAAAAGAESGAASPEADSNRDGGLSGRGSNAVPAGTGHTVATALAYQFFGHPLMRLKRSAPDEEGRP